MRLLQTQKNSILQLIALNTKFNSADFTWTEEASSVHSSESMPMIMYKDTGFYFKFDMDRSRRGPRLSIFSPGFEEEVENVNDFDWQDTLMTFNRWLTLLEREVDAPDLWSSIINDNFGDTWLDSNTHFTDSEKVVITQKLDEIQKYLIGMANGNQEVINDINKKFQYMVSRLDKLGRRDWLLMFAGVIVTRASDWLLTYQNIQHIFHMIMIGAIKLL